jgi:hypothetical protein
MADDKDDLMADVRGAMAELAGDAPEPEVTDVALEAPQETATERAERARDESGRFAKSTEAKPRETLTLKEPAQAKPIEQQTDATAQAGTKPASEPAKPGEERIAPPTEWKGGGKVKWDRLPREIQSELRDTWQSIATERAEVAPITELIGVNREFLVNEAGSVPEAFRQLINFARLANGVDTAPQLALHILQRKGLDPRVVFGGQPPQGGTPQGAPAPTADIAQLVRQELQPLLGQFEQQRTNQVLSQIEAFRADPAHPYFNDVAPQMEQLLKAGAAKDLNEAYDQAIWANPTIRAQLQAAAAEEAKRNQAAEVEKARKAASASLRGSPLPGASNGAANPNSSVIDDVRAAAAEVAGA